MRHIHLLQIMHWVYFEMLMFVVRSWQKIKYNLQRTKYNHLKYNVIGTQTIYLEQIRFLTNRVKELEREKDV